MTATISETRSEHKGGAVGRVARVIGPVVDVEFPEDSIPEMYNALKVDLTLGDARELTYAATKEKNSAQNAPPPVGHATPTLGLGVSQHRGGGGVRAIS